MSGGASGPPDEEFARFDGEPISVKTRVAARWCGVATGNIMAKANPYPPVMRKTGPTEKIIVLDVARDWRGHDQKTAQSALQAIACWQGLINRDAKTKIYLTNWPWRLHWKWLEKAAKQPNWKHPAEAALDDGLLPFPHQCASLEADEKFPALRWMLGNYGNVVKGKVLCPDANGAETSGARAAAVNVCTFEGALPLTETLDEYVEAQGLKWPLVADTRGMDNEQALEWSMARYMDDPRRNSTLVAYIGDIGSNAPMMNDYFVATHTFAYFLRCQTLHDAEPEDRLYDRITDVQHYPQGTPHIGPLEGGKAIQRLQKRGHTPVVGFVSNASVTSSIPLQSENFAPTPFEAQAIDSNGLYIAWEVHDDGDAPDVMCNTMYADLRADPQTGTFPAGIRINPYLIDWFPTQFGWFAGLDNTDIVTSMNDGGASYTAAGQALWVETYRNFIARSNGSIKIINFFGHEKQPFIEELGPPMVIAGYYGAPQGPQWSLYENGARTVHVIEWGPAQNGAEVYPLLHEKVREVTQDKANEGRPIFLMCRSKDLPAQLKTDMERLKQEAFIEREITWLRPGNLGATVKQWLLDAPPSEAKRELGGIQT